MRIDRDAAAVVGDGEESVGGEFHLDEGGVSRQRLVHRVVDDFGEQMMQRLFVGAADIHAGPAAYRLQPFQHLDVGRGIAGLGAGRRGRRPWAPRGPFGSGPKKIVGVWLLQLISMIWTWLFMCCAQRGVANRLL